MRMPRYGMAGPPRTPPLECPRSYPRFEDTVNAAKRDGSPKPASGLALDHEAGDGAQRLGPVAEDVQMAAGLVGQHPGLGFGALEAEDRDEGRLARGLVLARGLADLLGPAADVE